VLGNRRFSDALIAQRERISGFSNHAEVKMNRVRSNAASRNDDFLVQSMAVSTGHDQAGMCEDHDIGGCGVWHHGCRHTMQCPIASSLPDLSAPEPCRVGDESVPEVCKGHVGVTGRDRVVERDCSLFAT
jgi:hypothetical protein